MFDTSTATGDKIVVNNQISLTLLGNYVNVHVSKTVISYSNPFILIDFEHMDFNGGHECDMIQLKLTMKRLHS